MARYNSVTPTGSVSSATTITTPTYGTLITLTGASGYTTVVPNPTLYAGQSQTYYNASAASMTLSTPAGNFIGPEVTTASSITLVTKQTVLLISDGTNWLVSLTDGGPLTATSGAFSGALSAAGITSTNGLAVNTGDITSTLTSFNLLNATVTTLNLAGAAGTINIGAAASTTNINGDVNAGSGKVYKINGTTVLSASGLGSGVTSSSLTSVGTLTSLTCSGTMNLSGAGLTHSISSGAASSTTGSGALVVAGGVGVGGQLTAATIVETSSIVFKENITPITGALDAVMQLMGVTYDRKDNHEHEAGLIAEHVYKILPDLVSLGPDGKPHGIKYTKLTAYLLESVKTLKQEIEKLKGN